jgi:hypothetical protein
VDVLDLYTYGVDLVLRELLGIVDYHGEKMVLGQMDGLQVLRRSGW